MPTLIFGKLKLNWIHTIVSILDMEKLNRSDNTELLPALIMIIMIPLTFSIANGIGIGFISYVVLKCSSRKNQILVLGPGLFL